MTVKIRSLVIGEGMPKICVPIIAKEEKELLEKAEEVKARQVDMAEWRVDFFEKGYDMESILNAAEKLRITMENIPILFTFRSIKEGGERTIALKEYEELLLKVSESGYVDCVDVELYTEGMNGKELIENLHKKGVKVIMSNHDFYKTPEKEVIVERLVNMQALGADLPKIAVMPQTPKDVLKLLEAENHMREYNGLTPVITIAMGRLGLISRFTGEIFGSAVTFGSIGKGTAPGQIPVETLKEMLLLLSKEQKISDDYQANF